MVDGNPTCACNSGFHAEGLSCVPDACVKQCGSRVCGGNDGCGGRLRDLLVLGTNVCKRVRSVCPGPAEQRIAQGQQLLEPVALLSVRFAVQRDSWGPDQPGSNDFERKFPDADRTPMSRLLRRKGRETVVTPLASRGTETTSRAALPQLEHQRLVVIFVAITWNRHKKGSTS